MSEKEVVAEWTKSALKGDAEAQYRLGVLYTKGSKAFPKSSADALMWLTEAAEQGHIKACYRLGLLYKFGEGLRIRNGTIEREDSICSCNEELAQKYLRLAVSGLRALSDLNDADAMLWLAALYTHGYGVEKNCSEARRLLVRAADLGNLIAEDMLSLQH